MRRGDLGLKIENLLRLSVGVLTASQREGCRYVRLVPSADFGVLVESVVLLVWQTQSTLPGEHHIAVRVTWIRLRLKRHQSRYRFACEATHHSNEVRHRLHRINGDQQRQNRTRAGHL